jgi:uncharacterized protein (DUF2384 family)
MTRRTFARRWTEAEHADAARIAEVVASVEGGMVSALSVARAIGLPYDRHHRATSLRKVYDLMPLAVIESVARFPGRVLLAYRQPTGTLYQVTDLPPVSEAVAVERAKRMHTMAARLSAEVEPLRGSDDLAAILLVTMADMALAAMPVNALDAIVARAVALEGAS